MVRNKTKSKHDMSPLNVVLKSLVSEVTVEDMADMEANKCYQVPDMNTSTGLHHCL